MMNGVSAKGKVMPSTPSQDLGYGGAYGGQNGYRNENVDSRSYASAEPRSAGLQGPNGRVALEGYRKDIMTGFEGDKPRYNPVSAVTPYSKLTNNGD